MPKRIVKTFGVFYRRTPEEERNYNTRKALGATRNTIDTMQNEIDLLKKELEELKNDNSSTNKKRSVKKKDTSE